MTLIDYPGREVITYERFDCAEAQSAARSGAQDATSGAKRVVWQVASTRAASPRHRAVQQSSLMQWAAGRIAESGNKATFLVFRWESTKPSSGCKVFRGLAWDLPDAGLCQRALRAGLQGFATCSSPCASGWVAAFLTATARRDVADRQPGVQLPSTSRATFVFRTSLPWLATWCCFPQGQPLCKCQLTLFGIIAAVARPVATAAAEARVPATVPTSCGTSWRPTGVTELHQLTPLDVDGWALGHMLRRSLLLHVGVGQSMRAWLWRHRPYLCEVQSPPTAVDVTGAEPESEASPRQGASLRPLRLEISTLQTMCWNQTSTSHAERLFQPSSPGPRLFAGFDESRMRCACLSQTLRLARKSHTMGNQWCCWAERCLVVQAHSGKVVARPSRGFTEIPFCRRVVERAIPLPWAWPLCEVKVVTALWTRGSSGASSTRMYALLQSMESRMATSPAVGAGPTLLQMHRYLVRLTSDYSGTRLSRIGPAFMDAGDAAACCYGRVLAWPHCKRDASKRNLPLAAPRLPLICAPPKAGGRRRIVLGQAFPGVTKRHREAAYTQAWCSTMLVQRQCCLRGACCKQKLKPGLLIKRMRRWLLGAGFRTSVRSTSSFVGKYVVPAVPGKIPQLWSQEGRRPCGIGARTTAGAAESISSKLIQKVAALLAVRPW